MRRHNVTFFLLLRVQQQQLAAAAVAFMPFTATKTAKTRRTGSARCTIGPMTNAEDGPGPARSDGNMDIAAADANAFLYYR
jgi:hypothetical protein